MNVTQDRIEKIRLFAERGRTIEKKYDEKPLDANAILAYHQKLDDTLEALQGHVRLQEDDLRKLRISKPTELPRLDLEVQARISQIRRAKKAYQSLLQSEPELPGQDSPLPVLLALRETSRLLQESKASIASLVTSLSADRQRLKIEEANLRDAKMVTGGLEDRIRRLEVERSQKEKADPSQLARELFQQERSRRDELDVATAGLHEALRVFIDQHLAPMLAAEDSGGPSVGDVVDVSDETLEVGYTSRGRPKKSKSAQDGDVDSTQQRIDHLLQRRVGNDVTQNTSINKREAAATEMRTLVDTLLAAGFSYIELPQESAASRFLVKAKVAQFHPRDARRLRMIDFGRTIAD